MMRRTGLMVSFFILIAGPLQAADSAHDDFDSALRANVSEGYVMYPKFSVDPRFQRYVQWLKSVDTDTISQPRERLAFWINAYNALAIKGILDGKSPSSFFGRIGYFKNTTYEVGGKTTSLYDLEHEILRPLGEPRIHFAINCASKSCPILYAESYRVADLDKQLDHAARNFVNDKTRNLFDRENKVARLSKIFDWFEEDFGQNEQEVLGYVSKYVSDVAIGEELRSGKWRIEYLDYDWTLNGEPPET